MKKKIRYPLLRVGMVIGITIAYISFVFAGRMVREEYLESSDVENYQREETIGVGLRYEGDGSDVLHSIDGENVTGYISSIPLYADSEESFCQMNVYLHLPETFPFPVTEKIPPAEVLSGSGEPVVILGQGVKSGVIHRENGNYYKICGEEYRVIAYAVSDNSNSLDYVRILFYDCMGEKARSDIDYSALTTGITLIFRSDTVDLAGYYQEKQKLLADRTLQFSYAQGILEDSYSVDNSLADYQKYAFLLYVFSLVLVVMVTELWIVQRKKEFAIRRAVGYSGYQIIGMISLEMIKTIAGTGGMLMLLQCVVRKVFSGMAGMDVLTDLALCAIFIGLTFILLMIYPVYKIMTDGIAASIQGRGV